MRNFIKCFAKIKKNCVYLNIIVKGLRKLVCDSDQLSHSRVAFPETVMEVLKGIYWCTLVRVTVINVFDLTKCFLIWGRLERFHSVRVEFIQNLGTHRNTYVEAIIVITLRSKYCWLMVVGHFF